MQPVIYSDASYCTVHDVLVALDALYCLRLSPLSKDTSQHNNIVV